MTTEHVCYVSIDNTQNPYPLQLVAIPTVHGTFTPQIAAGVTQIPARTTMSLVLEATEWDYGADATLVWQTGPEGAVVQMDFQDTIVPPNVANLTVTGNPPALKAYGVSYFYASAGDATGTAPMSRDTIPSDGNPVRVAYTVVRNALVDTPKTFLPGIEHVVMLMLENRSLDHLLGQVHTENSPPLNVYPPGSSPLYNGLGANPTFSNTFQGTSVVANPVPTRSDRQYDVPTPDPGEEWEHVNTQVFYPGSPGDAPTMGGFMADYFTQAGASGMASIMQYYTPQEVPVITALARVYGVSDAWFCSVPTQTNTNRAFSLAGTSEGLVDNENITPFYMRTIFNVLTNCGDTDWAIFKQDHWIDESCFTVYQFDAVRPIANSSNIRLVYDDFINAAKSGTLPAFSYLEPAWYLSVLGNGNDYHPPGNIAPGEQFLWDVYSALTSNPDAWAKTLFIVTFDEHGGTMDHVPPPSTIAPDGQSASPQFFDFRRLGVRVPTMLVSPRIPPYTVFRAPPNAANAPFDHTSFLKTILGWRGIDVTGGVLGARAVVAPDFSGALSAGADNTESLNVERPVVAPGDKTMPLNGRQRAMAGAWALAAAKAPRGSAEHRRIADEIASLKTLQELEDYMAKTKPAATT